MNDAAKDFDSGFEHETVDAEGGPATQTIIRDARLSKSERERSFKIGGEIFIHRPVVAPDLLERWVNVGEFDAAFLPTLDETILSMLEPGQEEKWAKVRSAEAENPLTLIDMTAVVRWLIEVTSGRPTGPPSVSTDGREPTGTSSTADSPSPGLAAVSGR